MNGIKYKSQILMTADPSDPLHVVREKELTDLASELRNDFEKIQIPNYEGIDSENKGNDWVADKTGFVLVGGSSESGSPVIVSINGTEAEKFLTGIMASEVKYGDIDVATALESISTSIDGFVPNTRTVNGKNLGIDVELTASDVGALPITGGTLSGPLSLQTAGPEFILKASDAMYPRVRFASGNTGTVALSAQTDVDNYNTIQFTTSQDTPTWYRRRSGTLTTNYFWHDGNFNPDTKIGDALSDDKVYGRKNGNWVEVTDSGGSIVTDISYSYDEQDTGTKWVDGETKIFQKTIAVNNLPNNDTISIPHGIENINILVDHVISTSSPKMGIIFGVDIDGTNLHISTPENLSNVSGWITLKYTKVSALDPIVIPLGMNTDDYTTTKHSDYITQLHMTNSKQIEASYKGGEGFQLVLNMAVSPNGQNLAFGTDTSGVWYSSDAGHNWGCKTSGLDSLGVCSLYYDPDSNDILYAVTTSSTTNSSTITPSRTGLYRSMDNGATWENLAISVITRSASRRRVAIVKDSNNNKIILFGTERDGLMRSTDNGVTFENVIPFETCGSVRDIIVHGSDILLGSGIAGVFISSDSGATWSQKNQGLGSLTIRSITVNPIDPNHWIAVAGIAPYQTFDYGETWSAHPLGNSLTRNVSGAYMASAEFSPFMKNGTPRLFFILGSIGWTVRVSDDLGATTFVPKYDTSLGYRTKKTGFLEEGFVVDLNNPNNVWVSHDCEIYRSSDGGNNFQASSSGYSGAAPRVILFDENDEQNVFIGTIDFGLCRSIPFKNLPTSQQGKYPIFNYYSDDPVLGYQGDHAVHAIARDPNDPTHMFMAVGEYNVTALVESNTSGYSWIQRFDIVNTNSSIMKFAWHKDDDQFIYAGKWCSSDNGRTWSEMDYTVCAISPVNNDVVFSSTNNRIFASYNRGATWVQVAATWNGEEQYFFNSIRMLMADARDIRILWACRYDQPPVQMILNDAGDKLASYTQYGTLHGFVSDSVNQVRMWAIGQDPKNPRHIIMGGLNQQRMVPNPGFFESYDGGDTWYLRTGLGGSRDIIRSIEFHPTLPQVWMGSTSGTWIYNHEKFLEDNPSYWIG